MSQIIVQPVRILVNVAAKCSELSGIRKADDKSYSLVRSAKQVEDRQVGNDAVVQDDANKGEAPK